MLRLGRITSTALDSQLDGGEFDSGREQLALCCCPTAWQHKTENVFAKCTKCTSNPSNVTKSCAFSKIKGEHSKPSRDEAKNNELSQDKALGSIPRQDRGCRLLRQSRDQEIKKKPQSKAAASRTTLPLFSGLVYQFPKFPESQP